MTGLELLQMIERRAREYRLGAVDSLIRNNHMHTLGSEPKVRQPEIDALLVDFINFTAAQCGIDYGMHTKDLVGVAEEPQEPVIVPGDYSTGWRPEVTLKDSAAELLAIIFDPESAVTEVSMSASTLVEMIAPDLLEAAVKPDILQWIDDSR